MVGCSSGFVVTLKTKNKNVFLSILQYYTLKLISKTVESFIIFFSSLFNPDIVNRTDGNEL